MCNFARYFCTVEKKDTILGSLDRFIRKYYKNRMIKGALYALGLLLSLFLLMAALEHFGYFSTTVRAFLFWFYVVVGAGVLGYYVLLPLAKMYRLGKVISYEEAARIVGDHFPEVQDKLLNLLQLQQQNQNVGPDTGLLQAAIAQKSEQLRPIPFHQAVDLRGNRKYIKYAAIPAGVVLLLLLLSPTLLTGPSHRITHYTEQFERPAPFAFIIENKSLEVAQQEDFDLRVAIEGEAIPAEVFLNVEGNLFKMQAVDKTHYTYLFKTLQRTCRFRMQAAGVESAEFELKVFPKPAVVDYQVALSYPAYTGKAAETLSNEGDIVVPEGTTVKWHFHTKDVDTLFFLQEDNRKALVPDGNGRATMTLRAMQSFSYAFTTVNAFSRQTDTLRYSVSTIADAAPMIAVVEMRDSALEDRLFFQGRIKDDYGFTKLVFTVEKTNVKDTSQHFAETREIGITRETAQEFLFSADMGKLTPMPGDKVVYYFEVWDNDGVHGPKSTRSQQFEMLIPTEEELDNLLSRNSNEARENAEMSMSELKKMQEDINELMRKLVDKKDLNWQDKQDLQELAKKQQEVKSMLQKMQQQLNENKRLEQKYKDQSEKLMEKQKELDRLMNEVLTDEMKEMMKEMDKLMQEMDKKKVQEQLEQMKMKNEDLEKQLDQNIELMKRLEMEKKVEEAVQKAEQLSEKQKELSERTEQDKKGQQKEDLMREQQELSRQFDELKKDIQDIQKEYKEIDKNLDFKVDQQLMQKIDQNQQGAEQKLGKGKNKEASQQQKEAADDLDKLSEQLAEAQQDMEQQDLAEDSEMIRHLLKNLVRLSFDQEALIQKTGSTFIQDPQYQNIIAQQNKIKDDFRMVEDSLRAVARRQVPVAAVVNKNLGEINSNIARSLSSLLDMNQTFYANSRNMQASQPMQYSMTSFNNLALVLAEALDQMQNQMRQNQQKKNNGSCKNQGMKMKGNCSNPGKGKPSAKSMKQMQQELNKQMEALKKQMDKNGQKPGQRQRLGDKGNAQLSEEFARMAAQQEMIRRMMQEYGQEMKQDGVGNAKMMNEIDDMMRQMEQTETDLVNKVITQQTIRRQQQIMTRLLEHEKAEMQREKEERRESNEGKDMFHQPSPSDLEQFQRLQEKNMELFRTVPPTLSPFYKSKVTDYFYRF